MFLHLGRDTVVSDGDVLAVVDLDTATSSRHTRAWLSQAEREGRVRVVTDELPRSAVLCRIGGEDVVYICQLSSRTLLRRAQEGSYLPDEAEG